MGEPEIVSHRPPPDDRFEDTSPPAAHGSRDSRSSRDSRGSHTRRHCGALGLSSGAVRWTVWSPRASAVDLVLIDGDRRRTVAMQPDGHGYFQHVAAEIRDGQRYCYRLDGGPERPDPCSLSQPEGVHGPSAVMRPEHFRWSDK